MILSLSCWLTVRRIETTGITEYQLMLLHVLQISSILSVDSPVGTGYSYAENTDDYITNDDKTVSDLYDFLIKVWQNIYTYIIIISSQIVSI